MCLIDGCNAIGAVFVCRVDVTNIPNSDSISLSLAHSLSPAHSGAHLLYVPSISLAGGVSGEGEMHYAHLCTR